LQVREYAANLDAEAIANAMLEKIGSVYGEGN
jgi:hypothetical protein